MRRVTNSRPFSDYLDDLNKALLDKGLLEVFIDELPIVDSAYQSGLTIEQCIEDIMLER